jgi:hypothetical protein
MHSEIRENRTIEESWSLIHPLSPEDSAAMTTLRSAVAAVKGKLAGVSARGPFDGIMGHVATPRASRLRPERSEAYPAGGPNRTGLGSAPRSSICMVVGSTGEQPCRSAS